MTPIIRIQKMLPEEYAEGGKALRISYSFVESMHGTLIIASTSRGVMHIAFAQSRTKAVERMRSVFLNATYVQKTLPLHTRAAGCVGGKTGRGIIILHLHGTDFQHAVWHSLMRIPYGEVSTYSTLARTIGRPRAVRAVGTAVGQNRIAVLIPCHRVVPSSGGVGNYHWGSDKKSAILTQEAGRKTSGILTA